MPKMKTNRAAKKRFNISGTGRVRRPKAGAQHNMNGKSRKRLRRRNKRQADAPIAQQEAPLVEAVAPIVMPFVPAPEPVSIPETPAAFASNG